MSDEDGEARPTLKARSVAGHGGGGRRMTDGLGGGGMAPIDRINMASHDAARLGLRSVTLSKLDFSLLVGLMDAVQRWDEAGKALRAAGRSEHDRLAEEEEAAAELVVLTYYLMMEPGPAAPTTTR